jgi:hypothetical protein
MANVKAVDPGVEELWIGAPASLGFTGIDRPTKSADAKSSMFMLLFSIVRKLQRKLQGRVASTHRVWYKNEVSRKRCCRLRVRTILNRSTDSGV